MGSDIIIFFVILHAEQQLVVAVGSARRVGALLPVQWLLCLGARDVAMSVVMNCFPWTHQLMDFL
jgi:hypothetical protein